MINPQPKFQFPDADIIKAHLSEDYVLNMDYLKEKGISKLISEIAAESFANKVVYEMGVEMGVKNIMYDLKQGKNSRTGKLYNIDQSALEGMESGIILATVQALKECMFPEEKGG